MKKRRKILVLLLCVLSFAPSAFGKGIRVQVEQPTIPVLVKKQASPTIRVDLIRTDSRPYQIDRIDVDFRGTTDLSDIASVAVYGADKNGLMNTKKRLCSPVAVANKVAFADKIEVDQDTLSFWVAVTLKDTVSLTHRIQVNCKQIKTTAGTLKVSDSSNQPLRVGVALRQRGQDGVASCRIPGLATSRKGTLLAVFDARHDSSRDLQGDIDIALHRSTDKGTTWQPIQTALDMGEWGGLPQKYNGVSDACILVDKNTDDIYIAGLWMYGVLDKNGKWIEGLTQKSNDWIHQWMNKGSQPGVGIKETSQFLITKSTDDGLTWGFPDNITSKTKRPEWWLFAPAPGQGITLADGTLLFPTQGRDEKGLPFSNVTYSKDQGRTWTTSNPAYHNVTESNAVQLTDHTIMLNMRDNRNGGNKEGNGRRICVTPDLGQTWVEHPTSRKALVEPTCMGSLHRHEYTVNGEKRSVLLFVNPNDYRARHKLTLKVSFDDGQTWPEDHWILFDQYRSAGYSSITSIDEETIGVLYESSQADLAFIQINLNEILK